MPEVKQKFKIADEVKSEIDRWVAKYPKGKQRSAVCEALFLVQKQNGGWLSEPAMEAIAEYLELPPIAVFEAATFYDMYNLKPIAKHKISVCTNVSCMLRGSDKIVEALRERLGIGLNETTKDGLFTLREVECMAACVNAPMCQVDDEHYHEELNAEKMIALVDELAAKESTTHD